MNPFYNTKEERLRSGWRLLLQAAIMVAAIIAFMFPLSFTGLAGEADGAFNVWNTVPVFLGAVAGVWAAGTWLDKRGFAGFGQSPGPTLYRELALGLLAGFLVMGIIFLIEYAAGWISLTGFGWERPFTGSWSFTFLGFLAIMLMVGYYEELVFRGYHILNLSEGIRGEAVSPGYALVIAIGISSAVFGVGHAWNANASFISTFNIMLAGVALAVPYVITGRLGWSVGLHISWNFCQAGIFGFPVSGTPFRGSLLQVEQGGPDLFTGGAFGPEAGLLGILGLVLILVLFFASLRMSGTPVRIAPKFTGGPSNDARADEQAP